MRAEHRKAGRPELTRAAFRAVTDAARPQKAASGFIALTASSLIFKPRLIQLPGHGISASLSWRLAAFHSAKKSPADAGPVMWLAVPSRTAPSRAPPDLRYFDQSRTR
jgi:hypothetical protein